MHLSLILFLVASLVICFVFVLYPLFFVLISKVFKKKGIQFKEDYTPEVSIIICAKNEEKEIEKKIHNLFALDYPQESIEIIIVSDGSTDNTNTLLQKYKESITLLCLDENLGKTMAQNMAVEKSKGEILIFSDANSVIEENAVKMMVRHFQDSRITGVSGCLSYRKRNEHGNMEVDYNKLDVKYKKAESRLYSVFGSFGTLYAIRKSSYIPLPPHIISDFVEPTLQLINGYGNIFEIDAVSYEEVNASLRDELKRKTRIVLRSLYGYFYLMKKGLFKKPLLFIHSLFRKFLRWLLPLQFGLALFSFGFYLFFLSSHAFIAYCTLLGILIPISLYAYFKGAGDNRVFKLLSYVIILNSSIIIAFIKFFKREKIISWKPRQ
jgi:poly-beta-1,6-N-acetyl-D-glucosamine synthase